MTRPLTLLLCAALAAAAAGCGVRSDAPAPALAAQPAQAESAALVDGSAQAQDGDTTGGTTDVPAGAVATPPATEAPAAESAVEPTAAAQLRAVWIHLFDDTLKTQSGIDAMLDTVAASGANMVIAEVVRRQDAYYESAVLPRATDPAVPAGFDPLAALVAGAHERGLQLHAWVPLMPAYHAAYEEQPAPKGWLWTAHGATAPEADRWVTRMLDGTWADYLDPAVPAVRAHLAAIVAELASDYDVDGVHLDYVRYTAREAGYNPAALARYRSETGATGTPAPDDPAWAAWRRAQVTSLVAELRDVVKAADPTVALTAAVIAQGAGPTADRSFESTRGYIEYHQDWPTWLRDGLLDGVMIMSYFDASTHGDWFTAWQTYAERVAAEVDPVVSVGVGAWLNTVEASQRQLEAGATGTDGTVVYSFNQSASQGPTDGLLRRLGETSWAQPAPAPAWND